MFMNEQDAISGKQAKAFVKIDGRTEELFYAKSLEAKITKKKTDVPVLGKTNVGKRSAGWEGTGTLTIYYVTSLFRQLMLEYIHSGTDFYFDLQIVNEDPQSSAGKETKLLMNCNLDEVIAAKFDAASDDLLEEEMPFTFSDYQLLDSFNALSGA
ncbi:phage tail tube protein [Cohnella caldifontis]|uniref:phage tail tube protein n=1 Tax=Cohnella caldifontis TaxID=3027471 RepID=UPI0023EBBF69|nr:phage tail tube protein [Cohnella sp. YIM B05605]